MHRVSAIRGANTTSRKTANTPGKGSTDFGPSSGAAVNRLTAILGVFIFVHDGDVLTGTAAGGKIAKGGLAEFKAFLVGGAGLFERRQDAEGRRHVEDQRYQQ